MGIDHAAMAPLTLKTLTVSTVTGTVVFGHAVGPTLKQFGSKVSGTLVGTAAEKMAAKIGAKMSTKVGGKNLGAIIGIGVLIWDVWNHQQIKQVERPRLRQTMTDYFSIAARHKHSMQS
jgi:hypothetical protein